MWHLPRVLPAADWDDLQSRLGLWWALDPLMQFANVRGLHAPLDAASGSAEIPANAAALDPTFSAMINSLILRHYFYPQPLNA